MTPEEADLVKEFFEYKPEFDTCVLAEQNKILTAIKRAMNFISLGCYGEFYKEALYTQSASFLWVTGWMKQNQSGFVQSRIVYNEYAVTYQPLTAFSSDKLLNPYEQQLDFIKQQLGIGFGMILEL